MLSIRNRKNHRLYPEANRSPRPDGCEQRRAEATERQKKYDKLSIKEKIDLLDARFGPGQGAARQRARLQKALEKAQQARVQTNTRSEQASQRATSKDSWGRNDRRGK